MTPHEFIAQWQRAQLSERSAAQQPFLDLCELLVQPKSATADPDGEKTLPFAGTPTQVPVLPVIAVTEGHRGFTTVEVTVNTVSKCSLLLFLHILYLEHTYLETLFWTRAKAAKREQ